jgi:SAM-dependent methyltransferase
MYKPEKSAVGTGKSIVVDRCQITGSSDLKSILFLGYLPPVNTMPPIGLAFTEQPAYPAELLWCEESKLAQLGLVVDPNILFPPSYPYTSGTTRILRENFAQLAIEVGELYPLAKKDLVVDIGSNDGTLLSNFNRNGVRVFGIEPTQAGKLAVEKGIPTLTSFFNSDAVDKTLAEHGLARLVTAANVFAHIEDVNSVMEGITRLLREDGLFISESHYFISLLETLQYDTIYHEHLRYYTLASLRILLEQHGLEIVHARKIPTHGGSIRVYSARKGRYPVRPSVAKMLSAEKPHLTPEAFTAFKKQVVLSKLGLLSLLKDLRARDARIYGIGAPSRASTLINYVGLDDGIIDAVLEISGSYKIGKYIPGTRIPVLDEKILFEDQPDYALLFSWHIAEELIPKLRAKGYRGRFIVPLPDPRIIE